MRRWRLLLLLAGILLSGGMTPAQAARSVELSLVPAANNPAKPEMGNWLHFRSVVKNSGNTPLTGLVLWISLVQVDPGREQPVDLEDWSAHKAAVLASLKPGEAAPVDWPMRLIQAGNYRVVVSAAERNARALFTSPFVSFHVRRKPTVESKRILPVAIGIPLLIAGYAAWRLRRGK